MLLRYSILKVISISFLVGLSLSAPITPAGDANAAPVAAPAAALSTPAKAVPDSTGDPPAPAPSASATNATNATSVDTSAASGPCGAGMLLIEGDSCPDASQTCLKWLDPPPYENLRCGEYAKPATCKVPKVHRRFCIDRNEYPESTDPDPLPKVNVKWGDAEALCEARGARLCKEVEWEFACEGEDMSPYPYGWKRDSNICNLDRTDLGGAEDKLTDHRATLSAFPQCLSPFGVHDMVGNADEWVTREGVAAPNRSALRGGWWLPGRNRCRAATLHDETYAGKQVGFRCCKDP